jgi:hypothetical protein
VCASVIDIGYRKGGNVLSCYDILKCNGDAGKVSLIKENWNTRDFVIEIQQKIQTGINF